MWAIYRPRCRYHLPAFKACDARYKLLLYKDLSATIAAMIGEPRVIVAAFAAHKALRVAPPTRSVAPARRVRCPTLL